MPTAALPRRDPPNRKNGFSKNKGFTLIELMIVLSVLAVIASLALPSYRSIHEKRQVTSSAEQVAAFISTAQMQAVKHAENVAVVFTAENLSASTDREWCIGMVIDVPDTNPPCNCMLTDPTAEGACQIDGRLQALKADPAGDPDNTSLNYPDTMTTMIDDGGEVGDGNTADFVFESVRGMLDDPLNSNAEFEFVSTGEGMYGLNVQVEATGRVKLCSDSSKKVPGFEPCS